MIYKKGKNHRVLVCPRCGVLATNGLLSKAIDFATDFVPGGRLVKAGLSAVGLNPLDDKVTNKSQPQVVIKEKKARPDYVSIALGRGI